MGLTVRNLYDPYFFKFYLERKDQITQVSYGKSLKKTYWEDPIFLLFFLFTDLNHQIDRQLKKKMKTRIIKITNNMSTMKNTNWQKKVIWIFKRKSTKHFLRCRIQIRIKKYDNPACSFFYLYLYIVFKNSPKLIKLFDVQLTVYFYHENLI